MTHKQTYNSSVLIGNWFEDIALKEELKQNFLERKESGLLLTQQLKKILGGAESRAYLSTCPSGYLKFGDRIQLLNAGADPMAIQLNKAVARSPVVVNISVPPTVFQKRDDFSNYANVTASTNLKPNSRNILQIVSVDGTPDGENVRYGQPFQICSCNEERFYLCCDTIPLSETKHKSRHYQVVMSKISHFNTHWKVEFYHPQMRLENEGCDIPVGKVVVLKHLKTNHALALEKDFSVLTLFGNEYEMSSHTHLNDHKAEMDVNYWIFGAANQDDIEQCANEQSS